MATVKLSESISLKPTSLVMNDIKSRVLLLTIIYFRFMTKVVDVETAFLYREFEEAIHMEHPPHMHYVGKVYLQPDTCSKAI